MDTYLKLYRVTTGLGNFYVAAHSFDDAANELKERLDEADYGFKGNREITNIEVLAKEEFYKESTKQRFFGDLDNLIIKRDNYDKR